jgi:hypothetical protein
MKNDLSPRRAPIEDLHPDPGNARAHDARNISAIARSLQRFGQRRPLVVARGNAGQLVVIAGNGTLEAARSIGWPTLLVTEVPEDWDADKARAYALADNRTAELATWDHDRLAGFLEAVGDEELATLGWTPAERDWLLGADITPDELGADFDNDAPVGIGATAPIRIGPYRFSVDRDAYEEWYAGLARECGYREADIGAEIMRRLGL